MTQALSYVMRFFCFIFLMFYLNKLAISQPSDTAFTNLKNSESCENLVVATLKSKDTIASNSYAIECYKSKNESSASLNSIYFSLGEQFYKNNNTETALLLFSYCKELSSNLKDELTYAKAVLIISEIYILQGKNFDISAKDCQEVVKIARSIGDTTLLSESLFYLGEAYMIQSEYIKSLEAHYESFKIRLQMKDPRNISASMMSLGNLYREIKNYELALQFNFDNIKYLKSQNDLQNLGMTYLIIGQIYLVQHKHKIASDYLEKALQVFNSPDLKPKFYTREHYIADVQNNIGWNYNMWGKPEKALPFLKASLAIKERERNPRMLSYVCHTLGETYFSLGQFSESQKYFERSLKLILSVGLTKELVVLYDNLSKLEFAKKNFKKAYEYKNRSVLIKDSIFSEEKLEVMNQFKIASENEKRILEKNFLQQQLLTQKKLVEKQNIILISITCGLLVFLGMLIYLLKINNDKKWLNLKLSAKSARISAQNDEIIQQKDALEKAFEEIKGLNATKDRFFSIIAHDLRGPLNSLSAFSSLLFEHTDSLSKDDIKNLGSKLKNEVDNTIDLTNNLLTWARNQMKKSNFAPVSVQLNEIISKNIGLLTPIAQNKGIELRAEMPHSIIVFADIDQLDFIIRNLISNAIKFTFPGGKIQVNITRKGEMAEVSVSDTGVGMSKQVSQKIFNLDSNHSTEGTEGEKGTGLGLSLCRDFVELNGGEIWVESEQEKGSVFSFTLKL